MLIQFIMGLIISLSIVTISHIFYGDKGSILTMHDMWIGSLNNATMISSNTALSYVDYPTQALVKSCKLLPVIAFGYFRKTYNYSTYKYVCACMVTVGLLIFNICKLGNKVTGIAVNATGISLLFISLFFDGVLATECDKDKKSKRKSPFYLMVGNNTTGILCCSAFVLYYYVAEGKFILNEINKNNIFLLLLIGLCSSCGQIFIYAMIKRFDNFILAVVNTSRKFFSILFSIFWYNHVLNSGQWVGIVVIMSSLIVDIAFTQMENSQKKKEKVEHKHKKE